MVAGIIAASLVVAIFAIAIVSTAVLLTSLAAVLHGLRVDPVGTGIGICLAVVSASVLGLFPYVPDDVVVASLPVGFLAGLAFGFLLQEERRELSVTGHRAYRVFVKLCSVGIFLCLGLFVLLVASVVASSPFEFLAENPGWTIRVLLLVFVQGGVGAVAFRDVRY